MDTVGGQGRDDTTTAPSKGKRKAMRVIASDDEVPSNDDALLQRQLRSICSAGSTVGGPTLAKLPVPKVIVLGGSSGSTSAAIDTQTLEKATIDK
jgi:hypothetical protein